MENSMNYKIIIIDSILSIILVLLIFCLLTALLTNDLITPERLKFYERVLLKIHYFI